MNRTTSHKLMMSICGLAAAGIFAAAQGCSSSSDTGTGGHTGGGGSTATGTGGHGTGGGPATGTGGAGVDAGPACAVLAASAGKIADFTADGGASTGLALSAPYASVQTGLTAPTISTTSGALVLTFNSGMATMMYPYEAVGVPFAACANASAFTGVKFNISGTLSTGCTIQFSTIDKEHNTVANGGTCTGASCYPSAFVFPLPATATDVTVLFTAQTGGGTDPGAAVVDPTEITGIQWQINPLNPMAGDAGASCTGTVTIDNVTFL